MMPAMIGRSHARKEVGGGTGLDLEDVDTGSNILVEKIGFGET
jgi:hypothetical protein